MSIKNDRLLRALLRQPVDRTPLWLMRQAGRYLPEYRKVRAQAGDFLSLCKNPELAAEVTLQPITRFGFDAAILFSDILTIPDAMGLGLHFIEGEGPVFSNPIRDEKAVIDLPILEPEEDLSYVMDAVKVIKERLNNEIPLIGFAGSPWTIACYMVEGRSSKTFSIIKGLLYKEPTILERLLDKLADAIILYLDAQIRAGVDVIMLFDTWGGILTPQAYHDFSLAYMKKIVKGLKIKNPNKAIPMILFTKGISSQQLPDLAASGCDGIGIDWTIDLADARIAVGQNVTLQGNLDPSVLYGKPDLIRAEVKKILDQHHGKPGHIFNLGHGIYPDTPIEHVEVLVEAVQNY